MWISLLTAATLSALPTVSTPVNPAFCYVTEWGLLAYRIKDGELATYRVQENHAADQAPFPQLLGCLRFEDDNPYPPKLCASVTGKSLLVQYNLERQKGFGRPGDPALVSGSCNVEQIFNGRIIDSDGNPTSLRHRVDRDVSVRTVDLIAQDANRALQIESTFEWDKPSPLDHPVFVFTTINIEDSKLDKVICKVVAPFQGQFKTFKIGGFYYFVTGSGRLYKSACGKGGISGPIRPVWLGLGTVVTGVAADVRSKKVFLFTKTGYQELNEDIKPPKRVEFNENPIWRIRDVREFSHTMYDELVADKRIEPVKPDAK